MLTVNHVVLQVWETQIERYEFYLKLFSEILISFRHFQPSSVKFLVYHGQRRQEHCKIFNNYDIILTTYNCVSLDWKLHKSQRRQKNTQSLFSSYWHRVVLDEGEDFGLHERPLSCHFRD